MHRGSSIVVVVVVYAVALSVLSLPRARSLLVGWQVRYSRLSLLFVARKHASLLKMCCGCPRSDRLTFHQQSLWTLSIAQLLSHCRTALLPTLILTLFCCPR
jgi:hypothetical protein